MPPFCPSQACPQRKTCFHSRLSGTFFPDGSPSANRFNESYDPAKRKCSDYTSTFTSSQVSLEDRVMRLVLYFAGLRANPRLNYLRSPQDLVEDMRRSFLAAMDMDETNPRLADDLTDWMRGCMVDAPTADYAITNNLLGVVSILDVHNGNRDTYGDRLVAAFEKPRPSFAVVA
jgi:hypothetical protein